MQDYKSNFSNALEYGYQKTKMIWWKIFLMGILASVYVGIAYAAYIYILSWFGADELRKYGDFYLTGGALFTASLIFPVGLMMITTLGGSLFTSDTLAMLAVLDRKARLRKVFRNLGIVFLGNLVGGLIIACVLRLAHAFKDDQLKVIEFLITKKTSSFWYEILFSSLLSNLIVAGTVWSTLATKSAIGKLIIVFFFIWLFTITGFHHVIANLIIFSFGWLFQDVQYTEHYSISEFESTFKHLPELYEKIKSIDSNVEVLKTGIGKIEWTATLNDFIEIHSDHKVPEYEYLNWTSKAILVNAMPALVGNWFSGAVILPVVYWAIIKFKAEKYGTIDTQVIVEQEVSKVIKKEDVSTIEEAELIAISNLKNQTKQEINEEMSKETAWSRFKKRFKNNKHKKD
ncbi:formate/nitrite transporter family protein [Mycoplasma procyoni]|uniref:formate/nitrite transporter family protein n=1 Tax=Mycoplasma procyoni TaxID=568784 RepID=UPI00197B23AF|nr:formate/nitrite transporter family protein [Mycoplasma procyoni]MBN3535062.1 formate/nitrite transporter family protein [Mycoplasma procyoni]